MKTFFKSSKVVFGEKLKDQQAPRLKNVIKKWKGEVTEIGLVGIPFDYGVFIGGGRPGAAKAPDAIRAQIKRYGTAGNIERGTDFKKLKLVDCGNIDIIPRNSFKTHGRVISATKEVFNKIKTTIALGGGHDISYATVKSLAESSRGNIGGINVDAHFDVRPVLGDKIASGTPFRRLLEEKLITGSDLEMIGIQGHLNAQTHYNWLTLQGVSITFLSKIKKVGIKSIFNEFVRKTKKCDALFVSIDIDSVAQAFAPGSSAPNPDGLFPSDILSLAFLAGQNPKVRLLEIMEINPKYDIDNRTSRLAVNIIHEFLTGYTKR